MSAQRTLSSILVALASEPAEKGLFRLGHLLLAALVAGFLISRTFTRVVYVDFSAEILEFALLAALFLVALISILQHQPSISARRTVKFAEIFLLHALAHYSNSPSFFSIALLLQVALIGYEWGTEDGAFYGLFASACFNFFLILSDHGGQVLFFQALTNNLTLVGAGYFSGLLRGQLQSFSGELVARDKRIGLLQQLNHLIVQNIPTGLLTLDSGGAVIQSNPAAVKILDWIDFSEPSTSANIENLLPETSLSEWIERGGGPTHPVEFQVRHPSEGDIRTLKVSMTPIVGASDEELGYLLGVEDLTVVKQLEHSMRQSEKLAAVGQLAAGIAHEIRNPLASISGSVQMLAAMLGSHSPDGEKLTKITLREIDRLNNMITEFLDFVKPEKSSLKPMDLADLTREVIQLLKADPSFSTRLQMEVSVSDELPIMGDRDKLKQALLNIMINGCQAMEQVESPRLTVKSGSDSEAVWIEIQDNGTGMDEKTQKRIFEPFLTTKPKGTGLGLSVTHRIIENHHGRIFVQSQVNEGSKFRLEFPLARSGHQKLQA